MDAKESKNDMNIGSFFPQYSTTIFLHGFSASSHLVFLLVLSIFWAYKRRTMATLENSKPLLKNTYFLYYRSTLVSCICLSCCDLLLFMLNSLSGYKRGWPDLKLFAQFDFAFRTLTWFVISAYLCIHFSRSSDHRFPILLRIWWAFYFPMSCSSLVVHLDLYWKHLSLPFLLWIFDSISIISSLFFCYTGLFGKRSDDKDLHLSKPLLKSSFSQSNGDDRPGSSVSGENVSPYANASLLNMFTFSWIGPLLALGYKKTLNLEDIPQLATCENADVVFAYFVNKLESTSNGNDNGGQVSTLKLVKALILSSWKEILWTTLFSIICTLASYVVPSLINSFVKYLNSPRELKYKGYVLVFIFFLSKLIWCISERHLFFQLRKMAVKIRAALFSIIYKKGLRLSSQSKQGHTSGENINLMSVDVERTALFSWYLHNIWRVPVQIVLALLILYKYLGLASLVAVVATMILILANVPLGKLQEKFQGELMDSKDRRMKVASEALRNMRILKLHGWEMKFLAKITELRNFEIIWLKRLLYSSAMIAFVYLSAPMFVSMVTFGFCMLMRIPLDSGKILSALATFGILQKPIYSLPDTISMVVQTKVSLDRITSFLRLDDLNPNIVQKLPRDGAKVAIEIVKGNFSWDLHSSDLTLKDLNFRVYHGMRVAICGSIGSGKSSLLSCILGEVPKVSGTIKLNGTKAYVSQSPWIQSGKIVDNILFGKEMDNERYEMILEACSLKKDLELCAFGDHTIIGERGINLSGGQKQRIQIARALYHDADIYLLDDPFSAVDAHTGTHLFKISIDQSAVDISIPRQTEELLISIIGFLGTVAVMSQIAWQMLIVFIPMTVICIWYQRYYRAAARELSRLAGVCQAPIVQHFAESSLGSTTIRCFDQEERFMGTNFKLVDGYSRPKFHISGAMEWLCFRMDVLMSITYVVSLIFLISVPKGVLSPGVLGLAVTYGLDLSMYGVVWDFSILENKIISVERILQYACIPNEPPLLVEENRPGHEWPSQGKVDFVDLKVRYAPHLPLVLRGLTCTFPGGMKIGIVGRTGSGKSTLIHALFRMFEPVSGQILIDGIDISKIGLHDLRSKLSIIPQDPTMFEGTLRSNLDPLEEYTDEQIWEALDKCQLGDEVRKKERKLDSAVTENGENWSMGQRQLVCLGRVLLKRSKVLILDEATASVDTATDYQIQQTISQHFSGSTIITIAHRITTILDIDMVILMDNGLVLEYDSPAKLLQIKSSSFAKLVKEYTRRCS
ncbi:ABC transporter C family member 3-like isoform X1 [Macadamia integrifolia]|uniref:ABC transporter C family member 3-like isoform X1 n=1 Tax=Macadamia integrifolia TaxID=60698 RepID=UPI001C4F93F7|nr:ABC transporter C family member 3-like isoform X1 [Macadamia integrifolia]XP_042518169.1 ABC transporter C family member 3-like isoform X1 [Macadamia integrifolia]